MDDDDRRYWNPGALFAESAVAYWRRRRRSRVMAVVAVGMVGICCLAIVGLLIFNVVTRL